MRFHSTRAAALAGLLTALAVGAGDAVARVFPFGPKTRSVNDLGNQFVPYHAQLWDLLHGRAEGGLLLNWRSGYGTSFLPDLGTYLTSPFALLVGLFPRDDIDLAVYVVTLLKTAGAAAAMTALLRAQRTGGPWWGAAVLGASYGLCGWAVVEASYNPMWLDGLIAFPLLCLVGEWVRQRRHRVLGPVVVALAWTANFYTAYMATLGAALVLLARLATADDLPVRARARVVVRTTGTVLLGVALAAPVLVPVFLGSRHAYPGWRREFAAASWPDVLARTLPATYSFFTPALFLGTGALLLAAALAFDRNVPGRERWIWTGLTVAVAVSFQWGPTHLVWHVFATPNGSPYRQTFVLAGIVVMTAWTGLAHSRPGRRALLGGAAVLTLAAVCAAAGSELLTAWTLPLAGAGLVAVGAGLGLARRGRYEAVAAVLLCGTLVGQAAATTAYADRQRLGRMDEYPAWDARHQARAAAVAAADGWPAYRTDPGREQITGNDPLLMGGQGAGYYSSHTPDVLTRTLAALGGGWTSNGRNLQSLDNPVTDAVFSVGARVRAGKGGREVEVVRAGAEPPLVTVRPLPERSRYGSSPFRNQELLLGARVYTLPADGICPVGSDVFVWAPDFTGTARLGDGPGAELRGGLPRRRAAMAPLGTQRVAATPVTLTGRGAVPAPGERVGCLDRARLAAAVAGLRATGAVSVRVTSRGVHAELPPGTRGLLVVAAPRIPGWTCDGRPATNHLGLIATEATGATTLDCTFRPPGLRLGAGLGAAALLALTLTAAYGRRPGGGSRPGRTGSGRGTWAADRRGAAGPP
ncbi:YfhO family protein [Streptomyces purpureus]|uniref:Membrane protein n=1 Tax=Streptomyces purpureus TaxID=1951 RepID=A0A918LPJ4_9ACTN|nr:YfhO family protein [Streptomyces purpureus]GGT34940.1 membrane protein [Streptomyces purpureus]